MKLFEKIRNYWDLRSKGFSESVIHEILTGDREYIHKLIDCMGISEGDSILDVGCGPGFFALALADMGVEITGIDVSHCMIERARENVSEYSSNATFMVMDAQNLSFPDGMFDHVVSRNVLWNLTNPERAYHEFSRVLKPGGSIGILDGNYYLRDGSSYPSDISGSCHSHFNKGDVDFSIIENLAKDLPLSNVERPAWDVCVLGRAQWCSSVNVDFIRHSDRDNAPSESFMIVSRKVAE